MTDSRAFELFDELVELDAGRSEARLAEIAREDAALAQAVRRMLAADASTSGVLDGALADALPPEAAPADRSGQAVGAYRLVERIGRGGMGEVYRAERQDAGYAQTVAIKLLRRGLDSEDVVRRFVQERRILARLEHPGIARLIDGGMSSDGLPWLAMELVEGVQITTWTQREALGLRARIGLLVSVCDALDYAHRRLIVHRDLKPSNVLVGADGAPKLLDFGIAKLLDQPEGEALTGTGVRVLSPAYAAPEQLAGEPIGIATDVYALGLLLYELLTGDLPHARRDGAVASLVRDLATEPERPSASVRRTQGAITTIVARALEGDLDTIVLKALAHEPDRRYASAAALADDLRRHLEGRPIAARPDTLSYRMGKFVRRNRGGVLVGALALLGIVTALVVALWQTGVARREAARAERETAAALESASRTKRVKDFMMETFTQANPLERKADAPQTLAEAVDHALVRIDSDLADDPQLQVDLLDDFGEIRIGQNRFDDAVALFERALPLAEKTYGKEHPAVAETLLNLGSIEVYNEQVKLAEDHLVRAVAILERHVETDGLGLANALGGLAYVLSAQGRPQEAVQASRRALQVWRTHGDPGDKGLDVALHNLGTMLTHQGRDEEAEPLLREAISVREADYGPDNPSLEYALSALSGVRYRRGDLAESVAINQRRLALADKNFDGANVWKASALTDAGWQNLELGQSELGFAQLNEAIAMYATMQSGERIKPLRYLALGQRRTGDAAAALETIDRAMQLCGDENANQAFCAVMRANRAGMLASLGKDRAAEALAEADEAIVLMRKYEWEGQPEMAQGFESKALALSLLGRQAEAEALQDEALAIVVKAYGSDHFESRRVQANLDKLRQESTRP